MLRCMDKKVVRPSIC